MKRLQVLGAGCYKCRKLAENTESAAKALGIEYELVKVTDIAEILESGILAFPALIVDGTVKVTGRVPQPEEIMELLV
jgi:small redox-active disulfide protein 2